MLADGSGSGRPFASGAKHLYMLSTALLRILILTLLQSHPSSKADHSLVSKSESCGPQGWSSDAVAQRSLHDGALQLLEMANTLLACL